VLGHRHRTARTLRVGVNAVAEGSYRVIGVDADIAAAAYENAAIEAADGLTGVSGDRDVTDACVAREDTVRTEIAVDVGIGNDGARTVAATVVDLRINSAIANAVTNCADIAVLGHRYIPARADRPGGNTPTAGGYGVVRADGDVAALAFSGNTTHEAGNGLAA